MRKLFIVFVIVLSLTALAIPSFAAEFNSVEFLVQHGTGIHTTSFSAGEYDVVVYDDSMNVLARGAVSFDGVNDAYATLPFTFGGNSYDFYFYLGVGYCGADVDGGSATDMTLTVVVSQPLGEPVSVSDAVGTVFSGMGEWLMSALASLTAIFWTGTSLTIIGVLSVCALAVALVLYVIYLIRTFW